MNAQRLAHRFALATAAATFVLILFGGLVTNTGAALAVPDWPRTFGYNMFLFPWSRMVGGIFYEHSHRLIGALVGLLTIGLAAALWPLGPRLRGLGACAVAAVVAQGVLGGLRVVLRAGDLAILHGALAQAFFALLVVVTVLTSPRPAHPAAPFDAVLRRLVLASAALVYVQIVFGALLAHAGRLDLHLAGAVAVFAVGPMATARLRRSGDPVGVRLARLLLALLGVQLLLGVGAYVARFAPAWLGDATALTLALPVAHRLAGALLLGAAVAAAVRVLAAPVARTPEPLVVPATRPAVGER